MNQGTTRGQGDGEDGWISIRNPGPWDERGTKPDAADLSCLWSKIDPYEVLRTLQSTRPPTTHPPSPTQPTLPVRYQRTQVPWALGYELSGPWHCLTRPGSRSGYGTSMRKRQGCGRWCVCVCVSGPRTRRLHPFSFAFLIHTSSPRLDHHDSGTVLPGY